MEESREELREKFHRRLAAHDCKLTRQRKDILEVIISEPHSHFNAEELYEKVQQMNPEVGLATIYRTLDLFCDLEIIHRLDFDTSYKSYELNVEDQHHHHLICLQCGTITEFKDSVLEKFEQDLEKTHNFDIVDHHIKFYGYCEECSSNKGESKNGK